MPKKSKSRLSLADILASCSDTLFPAEMGNAPVTVHSCGCDGDTALHVMLWRGDTYAVTRLIAAGAHVNAAGDMSETPLHVAVRKRNTQAVEALLNAGANVSIISEFGQTAREMADDLGGDVQRLFKQKARGNHS